MKINKKIIVIILNSIFILLVIFFTYNYVMSKKNRVKNLENEILKLQTEIDSIPILNGEIPLGPITEEIFKLENQPKPQPRKKRNIRAKSIKVGK